eukprot:2040052-Rhodomonas_salina.1
MVGVSAGQARDEGIEHFYQQAKGNDLVLCKWFTLQVCVHSRRCCLESARFAFLVCQEVVTEVGCWAAGAGGHR